jgi:hypothetical protein
MKTRREARLSTAASVYEQSSAHGSLLCWRKRTSLEKGVVRKVEDYPSLLSPPLLLKRPMWTHIQLCEIWEEGMKGSEDN